MDFDYDTAFKDIANGNSDAYEFLKAFFAWFHALDDLIDRDKPVQLDWSVLAHWNLLENLISNDFVHKHRAEILVLVRTCSLAYFESERFSKSESVLDRIGSQVLKSEYQNFFYYTAYLIGGPAHMLAMSKKYRAFDFDPVPPPQ